MVSGLPSVAGYIEFESVVVRIKVDTRNDVDSDETDATQEHVAMAHIVILQKHQGM